MAQKPTLRAEAAQRSEQSAAMTWALTDAELAQVIGGGDGGPTGAGDRNG